MRRALRRLARVSLLLAAAAALAWASAALAIDGPGRLAAAAFAAAAVGSAAFLRPRRRGMLAAGALFAAVLAWWLTLRPRNDRDWQPDVARLATARRDGERLVVSNVRAFEHGPSGAVEPRWEERAYDLADVRGVDLFLCDWGASGIVHTILSFEFIGGRHLAVSIETRKEQGESYSALRGFFRQFELYYAVADERDVIGVRTQLRGERVRLYRLAVSPGVARELLLVYAARLDRLAAEPAWYNALTHNCTTTIRLHVEELGIARPWNWRLLANKHVDELLYLRGMIDTSLPFEELRERSDVTERARACGPAEDFAEHIRAGLPPRPAAR